MTTRQRPRPAASPPPSLPRPSRYGAAVWDPALIDTLVLEVFDNKALQARVRELKKVELASVLQLTEAALAQQSSLGIQSLEPMTVHRRLAAGLAGEALLVSSSMFLNTLSDAEGFFGLSFKTIKARLGHPLDTAASERALRAARVTITAADVLGSFAAARAYMHTPNFALGGATPAELVKTGDGERLLLNELHTQAEGGPL